jgi:hypothetical protein
MRIKRLEFYANQHSGYLMFPSYIINSESLLQRFKDDQRVAREMLECFRDSIPGFIAALKECVSESDQVASFAIIKKILRLSISCSAVTVQECAIQMEHAVIVGDMISAQEIIPLLEQMSAEAIGAIPCSEASWLAYSTLV